MLLRHVLLMKETQITIIFKLLQQTLIFSRERVPHFVYLGFIEPQDHFSHFWANQSNKVKHMTKAEKLGFLKCDSKRAKINSLAGSRDKESKLLTIWLLGPLVKLCLKQNWYKNTAVKYFWVVLLQELHLCFQWSLIQKKTDNSFR